MQTKRGSYAGSLWIPHLDLRYRDRGVVKRGLLCDRHMYAAHELLRYQFPHLHGLQSTLLSQREFIEQFTVTTLLLKVRLVTMN